MLASPEVFGGLDPHCSLATPAPTLKVTTFSQVTVDTWFPKPRGKLRRFLCGSLPAPATPQPPDALLLWILNKVTDSGSWISFSRTKGPWTLFKVSWPHGTKAKRLGSVSSEGQPDNACSICKWKFIHSFIHSIVT